MLPFSKLNIGGAQRLIAIALLVALVLTLQACETMNPVAAAETPAQKVYALSATYNVLLGSAAELVEDTTVPAPVRRGIQSVEAATTPVIDELERTFAEYQVIRLQLAAGETGQDKLDIATANLDSWISKAEQAIRNLAAVTRRN